MTSLITVADAQAHAVSIAAEDAGDRLYEAFLAGRSAQTRDAYTRDMAQFAGFLGVRSATAALTRLLALDHGAANGTVLAFRAHMVDDGLTAATVNRRLAAIRSAAKLARTLGISNWMPEVGNLKAQAFRDTVGPGLDGTRAMLTHARTQSPAKALRDAALIRLLFDLALRRGEIAGLDLADIDREGRRVWIMGKGRTQKEHRTLPEPTLLALLEWV